MRIYLKNRAAQIINGAIKLNQRSVDDIAYDVTAYDGSTTMNFIIHASNASAAFREAQNLITSTSGIHFTIVIHGSDPSRPRDIAPSQYIKPSDFGVML